MFPPAGNWPQRVSGALRPAWLGAAAGGGPSVPAVSVTDTELSDGRLRLPNSSPLAMPFPPEGSRASAGDSLSSSPVETSRTAAVLHGARGSGKGRRRGAAARRRPLRAIPPAKEKEKG